LRDRFRAGGTVSMYQQLKRASFHFFDGTGIDKVAARQDEGPGGQNLGLPVMRESVVGD
jgi:hypothetical protein